ncbi:hypothetical protein [Haladaptatus sp. CMAA 1911]|uniref:hypothetical protein n=1 Tax=unclassified Haladaptatus TaxID=2622732 RepID=UPI0037551145
MAKAEKETEDGFDVEDFESVDAEAIDQNDNTINLDPGNALTGRITGANLSAGHNGVIEIDGQELWLNATMRKQLEAALLVGAPVAHLKSSDEESFTDEDGEEQTYYPRELRFKKGDN